RRAFALGVFIRMGAAIQMIDDWADLEGDLAVGHYSYVTLNYPEMWNKNDPSTVARTLRGNSDLVRITYALSQEMLAEARAILARLNHLLLVRLVDATELPVNAYFRRELKLLLAA